MKRISLILIPMVAIASCGQAAADHTEPKKQEISGQVDPVKPKEDLPPISIYEGREYTPQLQKELDARNAKRKPVTVLMIIDDGHLGEDGGWVSLRDITETNIEFAKWPESAGFTFHEDEERGGESLDDEHKGFKYKVTWQLEAYWSEPAWAVVENPVIKKMVLAED